MSSIERTGIASQALHQAETTSKTAPAAAVAPKSGSAPAQQLSAQDFQAKFKLKEAPLDLAADRQNLQAALQGSGNLQVPESLNRSERFQAFMQQFFGAAQAGADHPTSQDMLQMQAQFLMPRSDASHV